MAIICPTVTAYNLNDYFHQLTDSLRLSRRIHLDIMDNEFTTVESFSLNDLDQFPRQCQVDLHMMVKKPFDYLSKIIQLKPYSVIIHNESEVDHMYFSAILHQHDIFSGLAFLQETPIEYGYQIMNSFDQVMIFAGQLGGHSHQTDLNLLSKVKKALIQHPDVEIAWDGGINDTNIIDLINGGVNVLNVGSFISSSSQPQIAYDKLKVMIG